jgi:WD40 repeat protein
MHFSIRLVFATILLASCNSNLAPTPPALVGTWELVAATSTQHDTTVSTFDPHVKMIKIINPTHFAFLSHSISTGADSSAHTFDAGGGEYTLVDSVYTEHLQYYSDKKWENNSFEFVVKISGDTLVQKGVEKVDNLGVNHIIVETYKRVK